MRIILSQKHAVVASLACIYDRNINVIIVLRIKFTYIINSKNFVCGASYLYVGINAAVTPVRCSTDLFKASSRLEIL